MKRVPATAAAILCLLSAIPLLLAGPMPTLRITIKGGDLAAAVEMSDPAVLNHFQVGAGPGNYMVKDGEHIPTFGPQSFVADWGSGPVTPPLGLTAYDVSFQTNRDRPYVVHYAIDASTGKGYVYIPGQTDAEYRDNIWTILRGVEGNWFRAWNVWESVANPLITSAAKVRSPYGWQLR